MRCLRKGSRCVNLSIDMCNTAAINGHGGFYQLAWFTYTGSNLDRSIRRVMGLTEFGRPPNERVGHWQKTESAFVEVFIRWGP